jgi:hypothetical protein
VIKFKFSPRRSEKEMKNAMRNRAKMRHDVLGKMVFDQGVTTVTKALLDDLI